MSSQWFGLSSDDLSKSRNAEQSAPSRGGPKDSEPDGSWSQANKLEAFYCDMRSMLSEERVGKLGSVVVGEWNPVKQLVEFQKELGKFWVHMGFADNGRKWLYPEEALYLMETNVLEVYYHGLPVSIHEAYGAFLGATRTLEEYQVYAHLRRLGYVLKRYIPGSEPETLATSESNEASYTCEDMPTDSTTINYEKSDGSNLPGGCDDLYHHHRPHSDLPHSQWDFNDINLPDISGRDVVELSVPDQRFLPENVEPAQANYIVDTEKISSDSRAKRKKRRDDVNFPDLSYSFPRYDASVQIAKNWSEYKALLKESARDRKDGPGAHLWSTHDTRPLVSPEDATSYANVMQKLQVIKTTSFPQFNRSDRFQIVYNVYMPNSKFKKSKPGRPNYRICVARLYDAPPCLLDILSVHTNDNIPVIWAVVSDGGEITFMSFQQVTTGHHLPT